jgi:thiol:disulfide interchange protein
MASSTSFDPGEVFTAFAMRPVDSASFDREVVQAPGDDLRCVFMWGKDCYNCQVFKQTAMLQRQALLDLGLTWFQADVYQDAALGRRFGLHGVPTFVLYRQGRRIGRITGWPGLPQFSGAVQRARVEKPSGQPQL